VDGVDVVWLGHYDLTNSIGIPGQFDNPQFHAAVDSLVKACEKYDKTHAPCRPWFLAPAPLRAAAAVLGTRRPAN
jgi:2-keto-3-deoxy-L-rhamnonate aldolase RhmA